MPLNADLSLWCLCSHLRVTIFLSGLQERKPVAVESKLEFGPDTLLQGSSFLLEKVIRESIRWCWHVYLADQNLLILLPGNCIASSEMSACTPTRIYFQASSYKSLKG